MSLVPHFVNTATFATRDFWSRRGASDAHTLQGSVRSEQRRLGQKEPLPGGLRRFSVLASLLLGHSPTSGDAPSSRLARTENRRNKRGRSYETEYGELFRILNLFRISDFGLRICLASNGGWPIVRIQPESRILFLHRPLEGLGMGSLSRCPKPTLLSVTRNELGVQRSA